MVNVILAVALMSGPALTSKGHVLGDKTTGAEINQRLESRLLQLMQEDLPVHLAFLCVLLD